MLDNNTAVGQDIYLMGDFNIDFQKQPLEKKSWNIWKNSNYEWHSDD